MRSLCVDSREPGRQRKCRNDMKMNSKSPVVRGNVLLINFTIFIEYLQVQGALPGIKRGVERIEIQSLS